MTWYALLPFGEHQAFQSLMAGGISMRLVLMSLVTSIQRARRPLKKDAVVRPMREHRPSNAVELYWIP